MAHSPWNLQVSSNSEASPCMAQLNLNILASANRLQGPPVFTPAVFIATTWSRAVWLWGSQSGVLPQAESWVWASPISLLTALWPFQAGVTQALRQFEFIHQVLAGNWVGRLTSCFYLHIWFYHLPEWRVLCQYSSQENPELLQNMQLTCSRTHFLTSFLSNDCSCPKEHSAQWKQYCPTGIE